MEHGPFELQILPLRRLNPTPQHLRDTPRLRYASARNEWLIRIKDFADRTDAGLAEVGWELIEKLARCFEIVRVNPQPRIDKWSDEPGPDGPLMIGRIARPQVAVVLRLVVGVIRRQAA